MMEAHGIRMVFWHRIGSIIIKLYNKTKKLNF